MSSATNTITVIKRWNESARSIARRRFERTGKRTSPYVSLPERETYRAFERGVRAGEAVVRSCTVSRWGGERSLGEWSGWALERNAEVIS